MVSPALLTVVVTVMVVSPPPPPPPPPPSELLLVGGGSSVIGSGGLEVIEPLPLCRFSRSAALALAASALSRTQCNRMLKRIWGRLSIKKGTKGKKGESKSDNSRVVR